MIDRALCAGVDLSRIYADLDAHLGLTCPPECIHSNGESSALMADC